MKCEAALSDIELAIVRALAQGMQSKEIATILDRSRPTIEFHVRMLLAKMQARSRAQIVARGFELGLLAEGARDSGQLIGDADPLARV